MTPMTLLGFLRGSRTALVAALFAFPLACDGIDNIDVEVSGSATIPAATLVDTLLGSLAIGGFDEIDFEQKFQNQGVTPDQVDSVKVKSFVLTIESPDDGNFDFLQGVSFFARAPGEDEVRIASAEAIPAGARTVELTLDDVELQAYATASSMTIRASVEGEKPPETTQLRADVVFDVDVTVPGCESR